MKNAIREKLREALKINFQVAEVLKQASAGSNLSKIEFADLTLEKLELSRLNFHQARFTNVRFEKTDIDECDFSGAVFDNCVFHENRIKNTNFDHAALKNTKYMFSTIANCSFFKTSVEKNRFAKATLEFCDFQQAELTDNRFELTDMFNTRIQETQSNKTVFSKVNIHHCVFLFNAFNALDISETEISDTIFRYSLFTHNTWEKTRFRACDFSFAKGLETENIQMLSEGNNKLSSFGPGTLFSGRFAKISIPALLLLCGFILWNLLFNYHWQSTPTLIHLTDKYLQESRYEKVSGPVSVLLKRNQKLPPELIAQMSKTGMENLALILSTESIKHAIDVKAITLTKIISSEFDFSNGNVQKAIQTCRQALNMATDKTIKHRILLNLANWYKKTGETEKMFAAIDKAASLDSTPQNTIEATLRKAFFITKTQPEKAIQLYEQGINLCEDVKRTNTARIELARIYLSKRQTDKTKKLIDDVLNNTPLPKNKALALGLLARTYINQNNTKAIELIEKAKQTTKNPKILTFISTNFANDLTDVANDLVENNEMDKAFEITKQALQQNPDATEAKVLQGIILASWSEHNKAVIILENALKQKITVPIKNRATLELLSSYKHLNMNDKIIKLAAPYKAIRTITTPEEVESVAILAQALANTGQTEQAIAEFEKAAPKAKDKGMKDWIYSSLCKLYLEKKQPQKTIPLLDEIITNSKNPDFIAEALGRKALIAIKNHNSDTATILFEKALTTVKDKGIKGWLSLELVKQYGKAKKDEKALKLADEIIKEAPFPDAVAEAFVIKAQVHERKQDTATALEMYKNGLSVAKNKGITDWIKSEIARLQKTNGTFAT